MNDEDKDKDQNEDGSGKVNKSLYLDKDLAKAIDDLRAVERPIPTFSEMAVKLLRKAVEAEQKGQGKKLC